MSSRSISIINHSLMTDTSGKVEVVPLKVYTGTNFRTMVIAISNDSNDRGFYGSFTVPRNYNTDPKISIIWATEGYSAGSVVWKMSYQIVPTDGTTSVNITNADQVATSTGDAPLGAFATELSEINLVGTFSGGNFVQFYLVRDGGNVADTHTDRVFILSARFEYQD